MAADVRRLGRKPPPKDLLKVYEKRERLQQRINKFSENASMFLLAENDDQLIDLPRISLNYGREWDNVDEFIATIDDAPEENAMAVDTQSANPTNGFVRNQSILAEKQNILLPSSLPPDRQTGTTMSHLKNVESQLCAGQANDTLHALRIAIGNKSFLYPPPTMPPSSAPMPTFNRSSPLLKRRHASTHLPGQR